ncbi:MAG TPA: DUF3769 domain-containing protein [Synechococcales cyanobacterium M55_K2018_004]|nr:DUF3769 domain-containing protein [Synechococcales cyanobacterium M55_K2018_004]
MPYSVPPPALPPVFEVASSPASNPVTLPQTSSSPEEGGSGQVFLVPERRSEAKRQSASQARFEAQAVPPGTPPAGEGAEVTPQGSAPPAIAQTTLAEEAVVVDRSSTQQTPQQFQRQAIAPPPLSSRPRTEYRAALLQPADPHTATVPASIGGGSPVRLPVASVPIAQHSQAAGGETRFSAPAAVAQWQFAVGTRLGAEGDRSSPDPAAPLFVPLTALPVAADHPPQSTVFRAEATRANPAWQPSPSHLDAGRWVRSPAAATTTTTLEETPLGHDNLFPALTDLANDRSTVVPLAQSNPSPTTPSDVPGPSASETDQQQLLIIPNTPNAPIVPSETPPTVTGPAITPPTDNSDGTGEPIEINADLQEYDNLRQVFTAQGNVVMRFRQAVLRADQVQVNLPNRIAVAEGNVSLVRGQQEIRGDRFVYNFVQEQGQVTNARGEVFIPAAEADFSLEPSPTLGTGVPQTIPTRPRRGQVVGRQGLTFNLGSNLGQIFNAGNQGGELRRIRFEAEQIDFNPDGWIATNVRLTNDPFSPPELELRSPRVTWTRETETRSILRARNPRLFFDGGFSLPLLQNRVVIDSQRRDSFGLANIRYDDDLGGLYLQRNFTIIDSPQVRLTVTPRILVQRAIDENNFNFFTGSSYGLLTRLSANLSPSTTLSGSLSLNALDFSGLEDNLRTSLRLRQGIGDHTLSLEYSYRDRLFNGSLGFQDVRSSIGAVLTSPIYTLGDSGINLSYQVGIQSITAKTDFAELLENSDDDLTTLTRVQGSAFLGREFRLWRGTPLPATPSQGLRFTPNPLVPFVNAFVGTRGVLTYYSDGSDQSTLSATVGIRGQLGHFSRNVFDYTAFNLSYSDALITGDSPFLFDRRVDRRVLSAGITQQIYGPFRVGFQTAYNLESGNEIDTNIVLEYQRRTYSIAIVYNPVRQVGALTLNINDFNWGDFQQPFSGLESP